MKKLSEQEIEAALRAWWTCALETGKTSGGDGFYAGVKWAIRKENKCT